MVEFSKLLANEHRHELSRDAKEYLAIIVDSGHRLQQMMSGLLHYSRLNTMARPFVDVSAEVIVKNCLTVMESAIAESQAVIEVGALPVLHADMEQLMQLFCILLDNALKFQPAGNRPNIQISAQEKNGFWQFAVADNGIGIAPDYQGKIFGLFQRLHTEDEYPGVGIGLKLAQKIVQRRGGAIWCESSAGQGATFYFTIPHHRE
jgi:light-regulated signal transduction histidine kinase (bacteriophytochrome)